MYRIIIIIQDGRLVGKENLVDMPNINNMAKNGINFINAYTNSPICCPSRSGREILKLTLFILVEIEKLISLTWT